MSAVRDLPSCALPAVPGVDALLRLQRAAARSCSVRRRPDSRPIGCASVVEDRAPELLPWLALIGTACGLTIDPSPEVEALEPEFRRARLAAAVVSLLSSIVVEPTVLCIDDAQWMDEASCDLFDAIVRRCRGRGPGWSCWGSAPTRAARRAASARRMSSSSSTPLGGRGAGGAGRIRHRRRSAPAPPRRRADRPVRREPVVPPRVVERGARRRRRRLVAPIGRRAAHGAHRPPRRRRTNAAASPLGPRSGLRRELHRRRCPRRVRPLGRGHRPPRRVPAPRRRWMGVVPTPPRA